MLLFGRNIGSDADVARLVAQLQAAAAAGGNPPLLIAVDQEGGAREAASPTARRTSRRGRSGDEGNAGHAAAEGAATASYLRGLGDRRRPRAGARHARSPRRAGSGAAPSAATGSSTRRSGTAFAQRPPAGRRRRDREALPRPRHGARRRPTRPHVVLDTSAAALDRRLLPFRRAIAAGVDAGDGQQRRLPRLRPDRAPPRASRAPIVTGLLRKRLGFRGVVITDALEAPGPRSHRQAPVEALRGRRRPPPLRPRARQRRRVRPARRRRPLGRASARDADERRTPASRR